MFNEDEIGGTWGVCQEFDRHNNGIQALFSHQPANRKKEEREGGMVENSGVGETGWDGMSKRVLVHVHIHIQLALSPKSTMKSIQQGQSFALLKCLGFFFFFSC